MNRYVTSFDIFNHLLDKKMLNRKIILHRIYFIHAHTYMHVPFFVDKTDESIYGSVVRIQHKLGKRGQLSGAIPINTHEILSTQLWKKKQYRLDHNKSNIFSPRRTK